jgi:hypothetical protein
MLVCFSIPKWINQDNKFFLIQELNWKDTQHQQNSGYQGNIYQDQSELFLPYFIGISCF